MTQLITHYKHRGTVIQINGGCSIGVAALQVLRA